MSEGGTIDRRGLIAAGGMLAASTLASPVLARTTAKPKPPLIIDAQGVPGWDWIPDRMPRLAPAWFEQVQRSGLTAMATTINEMDGNLDALPGTTTAVAAWQSMFASNPEIMLADTAAAIERARDAGRLAIIFNTQDSDLIGYKLDRVTTLRMLGIRIIQLTYNRRNMSGDGALEADNAGLSRLGHETISAIEGAKSLLDLSHGGARTMREAAIAAKRPPTISHTGCRALNDNPRNTDDATMKLVADKGGVVGIYSMPFLVASSHPKGADLAAHYDHALNVCGEDHVGIGTDNVLFRTEINDKMRERQKRFFEDRTKKGIAAPGERADAFNIVEDWDDEQRFWRLRDALKAKGWPPRVADKVLGENLLRLYREVWGG